jgi:2'-5' RNA ligase
LRLFVAVDVPQHLKDAIENDVVQPLRSAASGAKWTRPEGRHLTLKFLGNVPDEHRPAIESVVADVAARHTPFEAAFAEIGGFPNLRRPRVLWIGVASDELERIAADLEEGFVPLGFEKEERPFRGHLTLARFPRPSVQELPSVDVPDDPFVVDELVLFESKLHPKGARYIALARSTLAGFRDTNRRSC